MLFNKVFSLNFSVIKSTAIGENTFLGFCSQQHLPNLPAFVRNFSQLNKKIFEAL